MIKLKSIICVAFIVLFISSCKHNGDIKIGFLMPASQGSRWVIDEVYVGKAAEKQGVEILIRSAENDENLQLKQADELLKLGVDVLIVVSVNAITAAAIVRDAHGYNVPVIAYDRLIKNADLDYIVTFEGAQIGNLMVNHALNKVPKGNYVLLWGDPSDVNAVLIKDAQEATLKPHIENGDINIVYKGFIDNWASDNAYFRMKKILSYSDQKIDAVITSYDGLALGAIKAFDELSMEKASVYTGQDAELGAVRSIVAGEMSLTVYKSIRSIAEASVELAVKLAKGEKVKGITATINNGRVDVPALMLQPIPVEKSTIRSTVIADEFYTEEQVYGN